MQRIIEYYLRLNEIDINLTYLGKNIVDFIISNSKEENLVFFYDRKWMKFNNYYALKKDYSINNEYFVINNSYGNYQRGTKLFHTDYVLFDKNWMIESVRNSKLQNLEL